MVITLLQHFVIVEMSTVSVTTSGGRTDGWTCYSIYSALSTCRRALQIGKRWTPKGSKVIV